MKIIKSEYFLDNSGFSFEDLICKLLYEEYGQIFEQTGYTNDGGKDFKSVETKILSNKQIWAECKKYSNTLSYNDITNTLLMAYIEKINKILIFSYSPVNARFYKKLADYKNRTKIEVEIYDDENLEILLLKYRKKEWFSDYIILPEQYYNANVKCIEDSYKPIQSQLTFSNERYHKGFNGHIHINMYELFTLDLLLINQSHQDQDVYIDYSDFKDCIFLEILGEFISDSSYHQTLVITKCTSLIIKLHLRAIKYQPSYKIPMIYVNGKKLCIKKKLYSTWLAETAIIGSVYKKYIQETIKYLNSAQRLNIIVVEGRTGTGKSRLLLEIFQIAHQYQKKCFYCDIDKKQISVQLFCRQLFSFFTNLPFFGNNIQKVTKLLETKPVNNIIVLAIQILYNDAYNYKENIVLIATGLFEFLKKEKYLIIIDNLQKYDFFSLMIVSELIALSSNQYSPSTLILSFNIDHIQIGSEVFKIKENLKFFSIQKPERFHVFNLSGFDDALAEEYIYKSINIDSTGKKKYHRIIQKIIECLGSNPLVLQNYLILLYKKGIIDIEKSYFIIRDLSVFFSNSIVTPDVFSYLVSETENIILEKLHDEVDKHSYINLISCLTIFKELSRHLILKIINNKEILESLISYGIVSYNSDSASYSFRHIEIQRYYKEKYRLEYIDFDNVLPVFKQTVFTEQYLEGIFLLQFETEVIEDRIFSKIIDKIISSKIDYDNLELIYSRVLTLLQINYGKETKSNLKVMQCICSNSTRILGIEKALLFQERVYEIIFENIGHYTGYIQTILEIFKEYLRHLMNEGYIGKAISVNQEMKRLVIFIDSKEQKEIYLNELLKLDILTYYKSNDVEQATTIAEQLISDNQDCAKNQAECMMFIGNTYYRNRERFEKLYDIVNHWHNAYYLLKDYKYMYDNLDINTQAIFLNLLIKDCLANILEDKSIDNSTIGFLLKILDNTSMSYFEVKIRHLLALCILMDSTKCYGIDNAIYYTEESLDILSTEYGNKNLYATSLFFLAEIYKGIHDYEKMYAYFLSFYGIFSQYYFRDTLESNDDYLLFEMAISLRAHKLDYSATFNCNIFENIPSEKLYRKLMDIIYMPDTDFQSYYKDNKKISLFFNEELETNYPLI